MTSGSTGDAKMIEHSHFGLVNTASSFMLSRGLDEADSGGAMYNDRPFSWVGGSVIYGLLNGDTRVFRDGRLTMKKDGVFGLWKAVVEEKCTNGFFMPSTILDLIENIEEITKSKYRLKAILTGGQMISSQIVDVRKKLCKTVVSLYGLTEISVVTSIELDPSTLPGTLGSLFEGVEVKIVDSDSNTLPRQQLGEICFKCPWMLKGYRKASTKRRNAISDGWMNTGDIGIIDIEGNLVIKGKAESVIKRHTLKILSGDVEECIATLPGVKRVVIIAVPDARSNEEVCACVVLDQSSGITMDEVKTHCKEKLGDNITGYAPTYYLQFQVIPMLGTGKPDRMKIKHDALELINQKQCV
ncbi:putative acyl-CoA synthetase YngI [Ylistrum balloti]|uniref:putative acyl-CoA synthetase YngI n=1 Tax=Ylistrum balloti TaxID=509963 RepID=UPI002905EC70|nr:putative acyl-CoA synthetase YngI [Ylistrum balloti]